MDNKFVTTINRPFIDQLQKLLDSKYNLLVHESVKPNNHINFANSFINLIDFMNELIKKLGKNKIFKINEYGWKEFNEKIKDYIENNFIPDELKAQITNSIKIADSIQNLFFMMTNKRSKIRKDHPFYNQVQLFKLIKNYSFICPCNGQIISSLGKFYTHANTAHRDAYEKTTKPPEIKANQKMLKEIEIQDAYSRLYKKCKGDTNHQDAFYDCKSCNIRIYTHHNLHIHMKRYHTKDKFQSFISTSEQ